MSEKFEWANEYSREFLGRGYLQEGQTVEERVWEIAQHAEKLLEIDGYAERFYDCMSRGWFSLSSPVWSNYGTNRGLPVSCFGTYIEDSIASILKGHSEIGTMSKFGGGCSAYFGDVRPRGERFGEDNGETFGSVHFMELFQTLTNVISQGSVRRGFVSTYLPIEHMDIDEFVKIGTEGHPIQNITHGVSVGSQFIREMIEGDSEKREKWAKLIQIRGEIGYPYIFFRDNVNDNAVDVYRNKEMPIVASNMCLTGDTEVQVRSRVFEETTMRMDEVNERFKEDKTIEILSYNHDSEQQNWMPITDSAMTGRDRKVLRITDEDTGKSIVCTDNHKVWTENRGYVEAGNLREDDELLLIRVEYLKGRRGIKVETLEEPQDVYDFTVEGTHNFFANDILVHNCSEITLPSSPKESFVCVLSSMNMLHYDDWKGTYAVEILTYFLDSVVTEFLQKLEEMRDSSDPEQNALFTNMERAYTFAKRHRALGLGVLGWHSYLQSNMIAFEDFDAMQLTDEAFRLIEERAWKASRDLAERYGEPELLEGYGRRNTTLTAIAPTKSSAFCLGQVSQSIEPEFSNYYVKDLAKTKATVRNPYLEQILEERGYNDYETWKFIRQNDGSVQSLYCLTEHEKSVFKTFGEIDPNIIIDMSAIRQKHLDQAQSINLMIPSTMPVKEVNKLYLNAHKQGIKTLYYQYSTSAAQDLARNKDCAACEA